MAFPLIYFLCGILFVRRIVLEGTTAHSRFGRIRGLTKAFWAGTTFEQFEVCMEGV